MKARILSTEFLSWFGVFGAPFAWAAQHVAGFAMSEAACTPGGPQRSLAVNTVTIAVTVPCLLVALLSVAASFRVFRMTRESGEYDAPPAGRLHFMAMVGLTVSPLFIFIMLMSGFGVVDLMECRQS